MMTYMNGLPKHVVMIGKFINMHEWKQILCVPFFDYDDAV